MFVIPINILIFEVYYLTKIVIMKLIATLEEKQKLSELLSEIKDGSLQNILRKTLFSSTDINKEIKIQRPYILN